MGAVGGLLIVQSDLELLELDLEERFLVRELGQFLLVGEFELVDQGLVVHLKFLDELLVGYKRLFGLLLSLD